MSGRRLLGAIVISSLAVTLGCVCEPCDKGMRNKELVAEAFAVIETGEFDKLDQFIAADYVRHCQATPDIEVTSLEEFKEFLRRDRETVSDPKFVLHRLVAEDDLVAFWITYSGVQDGPMGPFPATGERMELDCAGVHRVADGKVVETWITWDNMTALTQLGLSPPQPPEEAATD